MIGKIIRNKRSRYIALLLLAILVPFILRNEYLMHILVLTSILAIYAISYNLIVGYSGQVSLGQQSFFGVGAYIAAWLTTRLGISPWLCLPACIIGAGVMSLVIGYPSLKMRGAFLAIVTLGFATILWMVAVGWRDVTGGEAGIRGITRLAISFPLLPRVVFDSAVSFYYLVLALLSFTIYFVNRLLESRFGRALIALRENEQRAISLGVNALGHYLTAFTIAGMLAGMAGFAYAEYIAFVSPKVLSIDYMVTGLIMVIVGGSGTLWGPLLGAFIFVFMPEMLRITVQLRLVLFGITLATFIILMPQGIYPGLVSLWNRYIAGRAWAHRAG